MSLEMKVRVLRECLDFRPCLNQVETTVVALYESVFAPECALLRIGSVSLAFGEVRFPPLARHPGGFSLVSISPLPPLSLSVVAGSE